MGVGGGGGCTSPRGFATGISKPLPYSISDLDPIHPLNNWGLASKIHTLFETFPELVTVRMCYQNVTIRLGLFQINILSVVSSKIVPCFRPKQQSFKHVPFGTTRSYTLYVTEYLPGVCGVHT